MSLAARLSAIAIAIATAAALAPAIALAAAPVPALAPGFALVDPQVSPPHAYVAGEPVRIAFGFAAPAPLGLQVEIVREANGTPVVTTVLPAAAPGEPQIVAWDGLRGSGAVAPQGSYRVRVRGPGGSARLAGRVTLRTHIYPVRGTHADRGPIGRFGVGRSGGRTHEGFDIDAACGTPLAAARGGRVVSVRYDPVLYGNLVIIRGAHTRRDYWYAHLQRPSRLRAGDDVLTGRRIGRVGATGNARTIGCHLHFEIRSRGVPIDPEPELHHWDRWS
ncbi:MAG TPA: peptidoglycan DD-metalloendopeptidase family protein [Solirubrobacteraceae bacterium]|nr:peptidoglycan DD-metalloendopeptidase family protein [Solirubrobacteraceae bacterium]